jgi:hypothetical protein
LIDASTDHERGIEMSRSEDGSDHRSCGGFPVRTSNGDAVFQAHQFREHFGTRNNWNFSIVGFDDFRIVRLHRGGSDDDVRAIGVRSLVSLENGRAQFLQPFGDVGELHVRAGNGIAQRQKDFGDAAHSDSADAHEVNALKITKGDHH